MTFQTRPKGTGHSLTRRASTLGRSLTAMPPPPSASTAKTTRPDPPPQDNDSTYPNVGSYPMSTYGATTGFPLAEGRPGDTYVASGSLRGPFPPTGPAAHLGKHAFKRPGQPSRLEANFDVTPLRIERPRSKNENRAGWPWQTADQPPVKDKAHWPQQTAEQPQAIEPTNTQAIKELIM